MTISAAPGTAAGGWLIVALPPVAHVATTTPRDADWWWATSGATATAQALPAADALRLLAGEPPPVVALVPVQDCPVALTHAGNRPLPQASAIARVEAMAASAAPAAAHAAAAPLALVPSDRAGDQGADRSAQQSAIIAVATTDVTAMCRWLAWCSDAGFAPATMLPAALVVPAPSGEGHATVAVIGRDRICRTDTAIFVAEDGWTAALLGATTPMPVSADVVAQRLAALTASPPLSLLTGDFAPAAERVFSARRWRWAAYLTAAILLLTFGIAVARLLHYYADTARIDARIAASASGALNRDVAADVAVAALDAQLLSSGVPLGSAPASLAAVTAAMEPEAGVALDSANWAENGTLTVVIGAPTTAEIQSVLNRLQGNGHVITARPRSSSDGRVLADVTVRGGK